MKQFSEFISSLIFKETYITEDIKDNIPKSINSTDTEKIITSFIVENFQLLKDFLKPDKIIELVENPLELLNTIKEILVKVRQFL